MRYRLFLLVTLLLSLNVYAHTVYIRHGKAMVTMMEVQESLQKFGYKYQLLGFVEAKQNDTVVTEVSIPSFDNTYFKFLSHLRELSDVKAVYTKKADTQTRVRLQLKESMLEKDFLELLLLLNSEGYHVQDFKLYNADLEVLADKTNLKQIVQDLDQKDLFKTYTIQNEKFYFSDLHTPKAKLYNITIPPHLNADYFLNIIQEKFPFDILSKTLAVDGKSLAVQISLRDSTQKNVDAFIRMSVFPISNDRAIDNALQSIRFEALSPDKSNSFNATVQKPFREQFVLVPYDIHEYAQKKGEAVTRHRLQVDAIHLKSNGYRVLGTYVHTEMGGGWNIGITFEAANRSIKLNPLKKYGEILRVIPGQYPQIIPACEIFFR